MAKKADAGKRGNGEGSIYQRKDGRWVAAVFTGYVDGKRQKKLIYGKTRAEVRDRLTGLMHDQNQGMPIPSGRKTVAQFLESWLEDSVRPSVRPSTYETYAIYTKKHLIPGLGRTVLGKLTPQDVQTFLNRKVKDGLSPRTVVHLRAILRRALGQGVRWGMIARNPASLVDPPRVRKQEICPLTPDEARTFLKAIRGDRLEALYTVAIACGLRQGEALALTWERVNLDDGTVTVSQALQRVEGKLTFVEPKTDKSKRTVVLPQVAIDGLRAHRVHQLEQRLFAGSRWTESNLVFTTTIGTPIDRHNLTRIFQRLLKRVGLPRQRFHDLRHGCASLLFAQGLSPKDVMETLGHSQISTTSDLYGHMYAERRREVAARMDAALATVAD